MSDDCGNCDLGCGDCDLGWAVVVKIAVAVVMTNVVKIVSDVGFPSTSSVPVVSVRITDQH